MMVQPVTIAALTKLLPEMRAAMLKRQHMHCEASALIDALMHGLGLSGCRLELRFIARNMANGVFGCELTVRINCIVHNIEICI